MKKLLQIEYLKVKNYRTFWLILGIYALLVPISFFGISQIDFPFLPSSNEIFGFPTVWNYITWTASWWNVLLGVLIVILVCNDIEFKTQRQNIIDGLSRKQVIIGKLYFLVILAAVITLYTFLVALVMGCIYSNPADMFQEIEYLGIYFIQTLGYFSFAFFFAVLVRKPALSIILFVVIIILDDIIKLPVGNDVAQFFPTITISDLTPFPFFKEVIEMSRERDPNFEIPYDMGTVMRSILSLLYIAGFTLIGFFALKRRDL
ncbi:MAG: ABC transporter permease subunit [Crocinitomicaceae bacterium]|nr:ABC transporter permease subunit [Crocinitomicaceae bacterium]